MAAHRGPWDEAGVEMVVIAVVAIVLVVLLGVVVTVAMGLDSAGGCEPKGNGIAERSSAGARLALLVRRWQ